MNKFSKRLIIVLTAGLTTAGLGSAAFAAAAGNKADCGDHHMGMGPGSMSMWGHDGERDAKFKEQMTKRHAALHDKLKLTAAQEPAWKTFTAEITPTTMPQRPDRAEMAKLSVPDRMDKMLGMMKEREQLMSKRVAATKTFYAALTPEQQKVFDAEFGPRHERR